MFFKNLWVQDESSLSIGMVKGRKRVNEYNSLLSLCWLCYCLHNEQLKELTLKGNYWVLDRYHMSCIQLEAYISDLSIRTATMCQKDDYVSKDICTTYILTMQQVLF